MTQAAPTSKPVAADVPDVMTVKDLAAYLQISERSVYNMASDGDVPASKIAGQWRFYRPVIDRWLEERSSTSPKEL